MQLFDEYKVDFKDNKWHIQHNKDKWSEYIVLKKF